MKANLSEQQLAWIKLSTLSTITPRDWLALMDKLAATPTQILRTSNLGQGVHHKFADAIHRSSNRLVDSIVRWYQQGNYNDVVTYSDPLYPSSLRQLSSPPLALFVTGKAEVLTQPMIAMVGSRHASQSGLTFAQDLAGQLSKLGLCVVSGLAMGIDAAAHRGAFDKIGKTIGVIGCGNDVIYPKRNSVLYRDIVDYGGCILSEFWPGTPPKAQHFPRRNRIIAGLTCATIVIEAKIKSGTLITANMAADLGKEVMAVPGHVMNPSHQGCHHLIQQGAALITDINDVLGALPYDVQNRFDSGQKFNQKSGAQNLASESLLDSVDYDVTALDIIAERNGLPASEVMAGLLQYELRGLVSAVPGGYIKLRGK